MERWEYRSFVEAWRHAAGPLGRVRQSALFDRYDWMEMLHRHCMAEQPVHILNARDGAAQGWLFLCADGPRRMRALANWYSFGFRPIFDGADDIGQRRILLAEMVAQLGRTVARIDLYPVEEPDAVTMLLPVLREGGWLALSTPEGARHVLNVNRRDFAAYWAARPGPLRTLVQRKGRGTPFALSVHREMTDALWREYMAVYSRSWKGAEPHYPFLRALAEQEARAGTLRLGFARAQDGTAVATQLWTIENGTALIHKLAHDAAMDTQSPGTLLSHHMFRAAIDGDGVQHIDYGTGDNAYKADWMEAQVPLYRIHAYNPRFASAWIPAARARLSRLVADRRRR